MGGPKYELFGASETAESDDLDFIAEYDNLLAKIDRALEAAGIKTTEGADGR